MNIENNQVTIVGEIVSGFTCNHEIYGESFYMAGISVERTSGSCDMVPVMVSDRLINVKEDCIGKLVSVTGQFRSYNKCEESKKKLVLSVFAREIEFLDEIQESTGTNQIYLNGFICKEPIYRKTPLGREITDLLLAVNRPYGKSDYIPCICWGRNARYANHFKVGERCAVWGRIQSREYEKSLGNGMQETRTAYEVSVSRLEVKDAD